MMSPTHFIFAMTWIAQQKKCQQTSLQCVLYIHGLWTFIMCLLYTSARD